ncbi:MAG: hypothetical protein EAX95_03995 [Candidatus Thorarchaeota archaeon]|nr:hypothetical protein [Candidatus Thorarchaeota archaeon]
MSRKSSRLKISSWLLVFMVCSTVGLVLGLQPHYAYSTEEVRSTTNHSFNLTAVRPEWAYIPSPITASQLVREEVASLTTIGSSVSVVILSTGGEVVASFSDVERIQDVALAVYGARIIVMRQDADAHVELTIARWTIPLPPPVVPLWTPVPLIIVLVLAALSLIVILTSRPSVIDSLSADRTRLSRFQRNIKPWRIITLAVLGSLLINPYLIGVRYDYFTPVMQAEVLDSGDMSFMLNATNPTAELQIALGQYTPPVDFRFHSFNDENNAYHLVLIGDTQTLMELSHENSTTSWEIRGESAGGNTYTLSFERIAADVQVSCSYEIVGNYMRPVFDPLTLTAAACIGIAVYMISLGMSFMIQVENEEDSL